VAEPAKKFGRPLRKGSDLDAAREAILKGCGMYETARLSGISMYTFGRLRRELRRGESGAGDLMRQE
jgi:hypothetical protein